MLGCDPEEAVSWCTINLSSTCTSDTTSFEELDKVVHQCEFIKVNDRCTMGKLGVPFKELKCGNCQYFDGEIYNEYTNE